MIPKREWIGKLHAIRNALTNRVCKPQKTCVSCPVKNSLCQLGDTFGYTLTIRDIICYLEEGLEPSKAPLSSEDIFIMQKKGDRYD